MIIEISIGIIAFCFILLTIYLILTLISARRLIDTFDHSLRDVKQPLRESTEKIANMTDSASRIVENIQSNLKAFDPFFRGLSNAGHRFENLTYTSKEKAKHYSEEHNNNSHTLMDILGILALSLELWQKSKKRS